MRKFDFYFLFSLLSEIYLKKNKLLIKWAFAWADYLPLKSMFYNDIRALRLIFHLFYSIFRLFWQSLIKLRTVRKRFLAIAGLRVRRVCRNRQSGNYFFILFFGEESSCLLIVGDFEDPSVVGVIVDELRVGFQFLVDIGNLSIHGGVDISCDLHALYHCSRVVRV